MEIYIFGNLPKLINATLSETYLFIDLFLVGVQTITAMPLFKKMKVGLKLIILLLLFMLWT